MKQTITNPNEVDWLKYWQEALKQKTDKNKDWDKAAPHFHKRAKKMIIMIYYSQSLF